MDHEEKEMRIGYEMHRLDNAIKKKIDFQLREKGLDEATVTNGWILKYLYYNRDKKIYQKDIERHFNIGRSTVTGIIQLMEKKELICRVSVENDARLKQVILLPKGEAIHELITEAILETNREISQCITAQEMETLLELLMKINSNIYGKEK